MAISRKWKTTAGVFTAIAIAVYVIAYINLRNRSIRETQRFNLTEGMLYDSVENLEKSHDLSTHHFRSRIFAPLNTVDRLMFGGKAPIRGIMFDLQ